MSDLLLNCTEERAESAAGFKYINSCRMTSVYTSYSYKIPVAGIKVKIPGTMYYCLRLKSNINKCFAFIFHTMARKVHRYNFWSSYYIITLAQIDIDAPGDWTPGYYP